MPSDRVLLFTDVEGSTELTHRLGDAAASRLWSEHDRIARQLLRTWHGREIDKSDGFLLLFDDVDQAVGFALDMHVALGQLDPPLPTRAGIHRGAMVERENSAQDVAMGAKPLELDGADKAIASRIMALARGGQTLLSRQARESLLDARWRVQSHGHWRMKGVPEPIELFEVGRSATSFVPPPDSAKSYRVVCVDEAWTSVAQVHHGLPAERDGFVGRTDSLAELAALFDDGARLVSLLGIGGIGKTRLALRYARQWLGDYPGGAWFCDLSSARSVDGILHAVAQGLDVPLGKADPVQHLGAAIAGRGECLVIIDNFEQVARHAEATLGQWLERAPQARLLVTSREVLGITGEEVFALAPMANGEAVQLFERRARAADKHYVPSQADRANLPKLVELLDRLPLAIELAAARVRVMTAQAMLDRMGERFKFLASPGGRRDRQATLRATLDWSWDLLSAAEQSALTQLLVFENGFTLAAAEAVLLIGDDEHTRSVVDLVQALCDKSLVRRVNDQRFDMLRSVHDYLLDRVRVDGRVQGNGTQAVAAAAHRHWMHFAGLSEQQAIADECTEIDNLIIACERALDEKAMAAAVAAMNLAWAALKLIGPLSAARDLAERVHAAVRLEPDLAAQAQWVAASAMLQMGQSATARPHLDQLIAGPDGRLSAWATCALGDLEHSSGDRQRAHQVLERALGLSQQLNDPQLQCRVLNSLGAWHSEQSKIDLALSHYEQALGIARAIGDRRWEGGLLGNIGVLLHSMGQLEPARVKYEEALTLAQLIGGKRWEGNTRSNLGLLHQESGRIEDATREFGLAMSIAAHMGHVRLHGTVACNLGLVELAGDRPQSALAQFETAVQTAKQLGDLRGEGQFRSYMGLALARVGRLADARQCLEIARERLTAASDLLSLGIANCALSEVAWRGGDESQATAMFFEARDCLQSSGAGPQSELAREITRLETFLNPHSIGLSRAGLSPIK